jgi:stalled ribosome alternative rescue factor ArfA
MHICDDLQRARARVPIEASGKGGRERKRKRKKRQWWNCPQKSGGLVKRPAFEMQGTH